MFLFLNRNVTFEITYNISCLKDLFTLEKAIDQLQRSYTLDGKGLLEVSLEDGARGKIVEIIPAESGSISGVYKLVSSRYGRFLRSTPDGIMLSIKNITYFIKNTLKKK